jgi:acyl-CoA synthetase (NDP forming)
LRPGKPLLFAGLDEGAAVPAHYIEDLRALGVPYFPSPERAFRALRRLTLAAEIEPPAASVETLTVSPLAAGVVPEYRAKQWLGPLGIPFPHGEMATDLEAAYRAARALGFPVALKAQAPALSHKSDAGGVVLNLADEAALAAGWRRMHEDLARHCPGLTLDGVLVERMGRRGTEMIIGARNDPHWGPIVLVGFGGIQAEVLQDVRLLTAGLSRSQIEAEILQLRSAAILRGFRGAPPLDVAALASIAARIGAIMAARTSIAEIDLNPVMVYPVGEGAVALDALMLVRS